MEISLLTGASQQSSPSTKQSSLCSLSKLNWSLEWFNTRLFWPGKKCKVLTTIASLTEHLFDRSSHGSGCKTVTLYCSASIEPCCALSIEPRMCQEVIQSLFESRVGVDTSLNTNPFRTRSASQSRTDARSMETRP